MKNFAGWTRSLPGNPSRRKHIRSVAERVLLRASVQRGGFSFPDVLGGEATGSHSCVLAAEPRIESDVYGSERPYCASQTRQPGCLDASRGPMVMSETVKPPSLCNRALGGNGYDAKRSTSRY